MDKFEGYKTTRHFLKNQYFDFHLGIETANSANVVIKSFSKELSSNAEGWHSRLLIKEHEVTRQFTQQNVTTKSVVKDNNGFEILVFHTGKLTMLSDKFHGKVSDYIAIYSLAIKTAQHLEIIHSQNIGHCNLTPLNIFVNDDCSEIKLINFCTVPFYSTFCNLLYVSPEQTGKLTHIVDNRSDFYSLGIILHELLTGRHPIDESDNKHIYRRQITERFQAPNKIDANVPKALSDIVFKLTSKQPSDRYQNATSLKYDLMKGLEILQSGKHNTFALGTLDYVSHISFPKINTFFELENSEIINAIKQVTNHKITILSISGTLSQGKNEFMREILKSLTEHKITNIYVTALKYTRSVPYYTTRILFKEFAYFAYHNDMFSREEVVAFFETLPNQLSNALIFLCPDFVQLFNLTIEQKHEMIDDESIIHAATRKLINFVCSKTRPLVIYVENVEQIDNSSFKLFIEILNENKLHNVVFIHSTKKSVSLSKSVNQHKVSYLKFEISELNQRKIASLLHRVFNINERESAELVNIIKEKTSGRIKQIQTFINLLIDNSIVYFDTINFKWCFDIETIKNFPYFVSYDSVLEYEFNKLHQEYQDLLIECACIGYIFDLRILQKTRGSNLRALSATFRKLAFFDFIEPISRISFLNNSNNPIFYKFKDTRALEFLKAKITVTNRSVLHNVFSAIIDTSLHDSNYLSFFDEFIKENQTLFSELSTSELEIVFQFMFAKAKTYFYLKKYREAEKYITYSISLLKKDCWSKQFSTTHEIYLMDMRIAAVTFFFKKCDSIYEIVSKNIDSYLNKIPFIKILIDTYITRGKTDDAKALIIELLNNTNNQMYSNPFQKLSDVLTHSLFRNRVFKNRLLIAKEQSSLNAKTLGYANIRLAKIDEELYVQTSKKIIHNIVYKGISNEYIMPLLVYSKRLIQTHQTYREGISLSSVVIDVITKAKSNYEEEYHYWNKHILPYSNYKSDVDFNSLLHYYIENGQSTKAKEIAYLKFIISFFKGENLKQLSVAIHKFLSEFEKSAKNSELLNVLIMLDYRLLAFMQTKKKEDIEQTPLKTYHKDLRNNLTISCLNNITLMIYFFLTNEYEKAQICIANIMSSSQKLEDKLLINMAYFYDCLIKLQMEENKKLQDDGAFETTIKKQITYFKDLAIYNADNFGHNYIILEAEYYRMLNKITKAFELYQKAIIYCDKMNLHNMNGYLHYRTATLHKKLGNTEQLHIHMIKAVNHFKLWGADSIANKIKFEYFSIFDDLEIRTYNIL